MWSKILLCVLVGLAYASNNPAWKEGSEYVYHVRGRTLTSLHEIADQYSGVLLKAKLLIKPNQNGRLQARIEDAEYAQLHKQLPEGWNSYIPDSEMTYKPLQISGKPFQMKLENGVIRELTLEKEVSNWEANIIKSIVSQFQLDTKAQNLIPSHINVLPEQQSPNGVFKVMEETVTGKTETLYDIHQLPEYVLQSKPWLAPQLHLKGEGHVIEIVKNKNYSSTEEKPAYFYGVPEMGKPASNKLGDFLTRESISRAVLTGDLNRFTIQNSYTVNKILVSPTLANKQQGSVWSILNVTLSEVRQEQRQLEQLQNPVTLNSLVYRYNKPYSMNNVRGERQMEQELRMNSPSMRRFQTRHSSHEVQDEEIFTEELLQQAYPEMHSAPETPFLPYTVGYKGMSIKKSQQFNVVEQAQKLAEEIARSFHESNEFQEEALAKFTILTALIRIMNVDELQQVSQQLYTPQEGQKRLAWIAFRDAVAQSGTGPALMTVKNWISARKIQHEEAAEVIVALAAETRQPTEKYMREFNNLIQSQEVQSQERLYEAALLAYTNLVRKVFVDKKFSHTQYPVKAFGSFMTQQGVQEMRDNLIPELEKKLEQAIAEGNTKMIHLYIRALGNVADKKILAVFEPYLEGKKQISQFQRLWMVVCLDKLAKVNPVLARSVLYKIYQNVGDLEEIRTAAVYQLMRTVPPVDMLQRMAEYTNIDVHETVNAAVKSSIEQASKLEGEQSRELRENAETAKHFLTKKQYGIQQASNQLRSFAVNELNLSYKQTFQTMGSEGSFLPKYLKYKLRSAFGGVQRQLIDIQGVISCVQELTEVLKQQCESYESQQGQQKTEIKFSSEYLAKILNLQAEEKEQLEGALNIELGNMQTLLSFNNHTIEQLPETVRQIEEILKRGKQIKQTKFINHGEMVVSFPTEMGLPFVFTYERPIAVRVEGELEAQASPAISTGNKLQKPETVSFSGKLQLVVLAKTQGQMSFVTPFDHQQYVSGYDRHIKINIPVRAKIVVDLIKSEVEVEMEQLKDQEQVSLLHYRSVPYTSQSSVFDMRPTLLKEKTMEIKQKIQQGVDRVVGLKETGIALRVQLNHEQQFMDYFWIKQLWKHQDPLSALFSLYKEASMQHVELNVFHLPQQSATRKVQVRLALKQKYYAQGQDETRGEELKEVFQVATESGIRQEQMIKKAAAGIHNVEVRAWDASVEFKGQRNVKYLLTGAVAKSNVDPKARILIQAMRESTVPQIKPYRLAMVIRSYARNTNGLNMIHAFEKEPMVDTHVKIAFGQQYEQAARINTQIQHRRTEERKQYLLTEPTYKQCKHEMEHGNKQLHACANMTIRAGFLDHMDIKVEHQNWNPAMKKMIEQVYDAARFQLYPAVEIKNEQGESQKIHAKIQFAPNFQAVNVSVQTENEHTALRNLQVQQWAKPIIAVHPVFHLASRVKSQLLANELIREICVVDKTQALTFSNRTFPAKIGNIWTVMLQYVPRHARQHQQEQTVEQQIKRQVENYAVLVRENEQNREQKEVKITVRLPQTNKVVDITMTPASQTSGLEKRERNAVKVTVDGQQIQISEKKSHDIHENMIQIYELPQGEVKVEVRDAFYVIYDGARVKLTVTDSKLHKSVRGICGQLNREKATDLLTSDNCIVEDHKELIRSYQVQEGVYQQQPRHKCHQKQVLYANVISHRDSGRQEQENDMIRHSEVCTHYQTRFVEAENEICFTLRPLPVCRCQQRGIIKKTVPVYCLQKTNAAELWKKQILKGASPDFSLKTPTKHVEIELPKSCSQ